MPRPNRPCLDCGDATPNTRCAPCTTAHEALRPPRRVRGRYDTRYQRLRDKAIREQPWCSNCKTPGTLDNPLTGDHRVPVQLGGRNERTNIDVLCRCCNSAKRDRVMGRDGEREGIGGFDL